LLKKATHEFLAMKKNTNYILLITKFLAIELTCQCYSDFIHRAANAD